MPSIETPLPLEALGRAMPVAEFVGLVADEQKTPGLELRTRWNLALTAIRACWPGGLSEEDRRLTLFVAQKQPMPHHLLELAHCATLFSSDIIYNPLSPTEDTAWGEDEPAGKQIVALEQKRLRDNWLFQRWTVAQQAASRVLERPNLNPRLRTVVRICQSHPMQWDHLQKLEGLILLLNEPAEKIPSKLEPADPNAATEWGHIFQLLELAGA